jgi:electron transport complex protein RnfE
MGKCTERLYNGIVKENPTFVQILGMCPTLAVTSSAINGAGMGLATTCILVLSNVVISMLRKVIPDKVRIPSYIVIIASFVTVIQFLMEAYLPSLNDALGIYIPLIVVNCIILGRAESYASKNKVLPSMFDGIGMGLGFTLGLTIIGAFRELIGKGCVFGIQILGEGNILQGKTGFAHQVGTVLGCYTPITIFVLAPGAFFVLAFIIAIINKRNAKKREAAGEAYVCRQEGCGSCTNTMCGGRINITPAEPKEENKNEPQMTQPENVENKPEEEKKHQPEENNQAEEQEKQPENPPENVETENNETIENTENTENTESSDEPEDASDGQTERLKGKGGKK